MIVFCQANNPNFLKTQEDDFQMTFSHSETESQLFRAIHLQLKNLFSSIGYCLAYTGLCEQLIAESIAQPNSLSNQGSFGPVIRGKELSCNIKCTRPKIQTILRLGPRLENPIGNVSFEKLNRVYMISKSIDQPSSLPNQGSFNPVKAR